MLHGRTTFSKFIIEEQRRMEKPDAADVLREYVVRRMARPHFANARSIRNALDRARLRQASRLFAERDRVLDRDALATLEAADIRASRVFAA